MNQIWLVARWEFLATVMRVGFVATVLTSSGLLQQAMAAERHNRVLEVLLVSVSPRSR